MALDDVLKPLGVFVAVIVVVLGLTAVSAALLGGGSAPPAQGQSIEGQSPQQFQPDSVNAAADPESGEITIDGNNEPKRILVDTQHGNQFSQSNLELFVEALREAGHTVKFTAGSSDGFGETSYNQTLQEFDAVLVIQPTESFSDGERAGLREYTNGGGRVVVLGEPTQLQGGGLFTAPSSVSFGATELATSYGVTMGAEGLYNVDDASNDNNFKAIYADPSGSGMLTRGVDTVTFESSGYLVTTGDSNVNTRFTAVDGTKTLETRRTGTYATVARNGNFVMVADSDFIETNEIYDADNEVLVGNLMQFMVSGDKPGDVPEAGGSSGDDGFGNGNGS